MNNALKIDPTEISQSQTRAKIEKQKTPNLFFYPYASYQKAIVSYLYQKWVPTMGHSKKLRRFFLNEKIGKQKTPDLIFYPYALIKKAISFYLDWICVLTM